MDLYCGFAIYENKLAGYKLLVTQIGTIIYVTQLCLLIT
jgi:hypothetical protein